ncbi:MAG TPA: FAD-dependent oxidoreductase [Bryobacteraceae bacterium]|nr:FAD-dependent oxidoreductase [Bryobacteraceae bacterium]
MIGGGALGLAAALRLAEAGVRVTLIEQEPRLGGLAAGFDPGQGSSATLEKFYHHLFRTDRVAIGFIRQLGLIDRLEWKRPVTATLRNGRVYPMTPAAMLQFDAIPLADRLRLIATLAALKLAPNERPFTGQTATGWTRRWAGQPAYNALLGPLLAGKFGARAPEIAMGWLWSRFHERSLALGYLRGGFQQLYDAFGERLRSLGGTIMLETRATSIESNGAAVTTTTDDGSIEADGLLVTTPEHVLVRLAPQLKEECALKPGPDFYSAHVLILALDRPLTNEYWINIADPGYPFLVLVEHTNFMPAADYGGQHLIYLGNYLPPDAPVFSQSDSEVLDAYLPALARFNPSFHRSWVTSHWVFQAPYAQPIVTQGYADRLPSHRTSMPGVYFATMAHVYPQDRGQNYSLALGERMAAMMLDDGS